MSLLPTGAVATVPVVAANAVNVPAAGTDAPMVELLIVAPVYEPPVIVLPENSSEGDRLIVTALVPLTLMAFAVPVMLVTGAVPDATEVS